MNKGKKTHNTGKASIPPPKKVAARSAPPKLKPTLPQHRFPAPYDRLLTLGEREDYNAIHKEIAEQLKSKATDQEKAVQQLISMALDTSYYGYQDPKNWNEEDPRYWTRLHAAAVLKYMGAAANAAIEPLLVLLDEEDDDLCEEMPLFYGAVGEPAIEPLSRIVRDVAAYDLVRGSACDCLKEIGERHPELRPKIVPILEQVVEQTYDGPDLTAIAISALLDLKAVDSLPTIQRAFEQNRVDRFIVDLSDVEEAFDLPRTSVSAMILQKPGRPGTSRDQKDLDSSNKLDEAPVEEIEGPTAPAETTPQQPFVNAVKLGRNDPCWCGSGKKFKACHGG